MKYANLAPNKQVGNYKWNHQAHLGSGAFGKVYLGYDLLNQIVAIKIIDNSDLKQDQMIRALKNEVQILKLLQGDNVCKLLDFLQTKNRTYIIQPFAKDGDLRSFLNKNNKVKEEQAVKMLAQCVSGYKELFDRQIIHRDLKPENILINGDQLWLADFGFSRMVHQYDTNLLHTSCGTPIYMAPQILQNLQYSTKSDIWSFGIIYYEMLFGTHPWNCDSQKELIYKSLNEPLQFPCGTKISKDSINFLKGCINPNEQNRFTWQQVFNHQLFQSSTKSHYQVYNNQLNTHQKSIMINIQNVYKQNNIKLTNNFKKYDKDQSGALSCQEFCQLIIGDCPDISEFDLIHIFKHIDTNSDNQIQIDELWNLVFETNYADETCKNKLLQQEKAKRCLKKFKDIITEHSLDIPGIFNRFDTSHDGNLDFNEFKKLVCLIDDQLTTPEVQIIFEIFDKDNNNQISIQEFKKELAFCQDQDQNIIAQVNNLNISQSAQSTLIQLKQIVNKHQIDPRQIFLKFDQDKSGFIDKNEFLKIMQIINVNIQQNDSDQLFQLVSQNSDSQIALEQFANIFL